jgi:hypothetical protein
MKRQEAVTCLKEIRVNCSHMSPEIVELINSQPDDQFSTGYQLHIQTLLDQQTKQQIRLIAAKRRLALKEENGRVVIYQPKPAP